jgi:hypothetical protein
MSNFDWEKLPQTLLFGGIVIAVYLGMQHVLGFTELHARRYMIGLGFILAGAIVLWRGEVPVDFWGRMAPRLSRPWTGRAAISVGVFVVAFGLAVLIFAPDTAFVRNTYYGIFSRP